MSGRSRLKAHKTPQIELRTHGKPIPAVSVIKVLGLKIQDNGYNTEAIKTLENSVLQTTRLISRVANRHQGLQESNLIRLIQTFILSRLAYATPFLSLKTDEKTKINNMIRKVYKQALGIPITTPNNKFDALGLHNTLSELIEAQQTSQLERLTKSNTGRQILRKLNIGYDAQHVAKKEIKPEIRTQIYVPPLPRNMHPIHNQERRMERAKALHKRFENLHEIVYVDAADYADQAAMTVVVVNQKGQLLTSGTVLTTTTEIGEEAAISLAIASTQAKVIVSDSKTAIRNFAKGRISNIALKILNSNGTTNIRNIQLVWAPAHSGLPGNENAHQLARGLADQASTNETTEPLTFRTADRDRMVTYSEILDHYRKGRLYYPEAHKTLNKQQATAWRRIQTGMYANPVLHSYYYPGIQDDKCKHCKQRADLKHIIWSCSKIDKSDQRTLIINTPEQWEAALLSSEADIQLQVVRMAEAAARDQGLLADG